MRKNKSDRVPFGRSVAIWWLSSTVVGPANEKVVSGFVWRGEEVFSFRRGDVGRRAK